jgi:hypothetical protein
MNMEDRCLAGKPGAGELKGYEVGAHKGGALGDLGTCWILISWAWLRSGRRPPAKTAGYCRRL